MAGVAATLTGLVFVAVSINLSRILTVPGLTGRAAESMLQLLGVVAISTTALIPWQPPPALGIEILLLDFILWLIQTVLQIRYVRSKTGHPLSWAAIRIVQTQCASIPFCVAGVLLVRGSHTGMYWLTPGFILSLVAGVANAWVLLVEILR
jgi:modulator of FtsH protease